MKQIKRATPDGELKLVYVQAVLMPNGEILHNTQGCIGYYIAADSDKQDHPDGILARYVYEETGGE